MGLTYVTQQPRAIAEEILSQTNNFFVMHLLSKGDIKALTDVNPHYGGVIKDFIQTESLVGHTYIYSAVPNMPIQSYVFGAKAIKFDTVGNRLEKLKPKGYRAYRQKRLKYVGAIAEKIDSRIPTLPDDEDAEHDYFRWYKLASIGKQLPEEWPVYNRDPRYSDFIDDPWLRDALKELGLPFKRVWREDKGGKTHPYLAFPKPKEKQVPYEEEEEIPF